MGEKIKRVQNEDDLKFLESIDRDALLTVEEELELIGRIRRGEGDVEADKDRLMRGCDRFVLAVARQYVSDEFTLDELMAEGNKGLEKAIYRYDVACGYRFISYGVWWIRQYILHYVKTNSHA